MRRRSGRGRRFPPGATLTPLKGPAAALAGYMEQSLTIPTATSFRTLAVDVLDARRKELNGAIKAAGRSEKISFTHVVAFALVRAARELPFITYSFRRDEKGAPARLEPGVHLGLAVDSERKDGSRFLVVPVIKNAAALDFAAFRSAYEELVAKARDNKLVADDLQGASFTLTNPGGIGTVASVPRLMAGTGRDYRHRRDRLSAGIRRRQRAVAAAAGRFEDHADDEHLRSSRDSRRAVGRIPAPRRRTAARTRRILRRDLRVARSAGGAGPADHHDVAGRASARRRGARRPPTRCCARVAAGMAIVSAYRRHGHLAAHLDPLGTPPVGDPSLEPQTYGLTPALMSAIPAGVLRVKVPGNTLAEVLPHLKETYSSTIAYEIEHISNAEQRVWLRDYIESGKNKVTFSPERQIEFLSRLTRVEAFDRYVRKTFLGQKTFSGEGLDVMVPMLEEMLDMFADDGVRNAVLGMAHRGRLNVIAHVVNAPYEEAMMEFEAAQYRGELGDDDVMGDVKYHHGATGTFVTSKGKIDRRDARAQSEPSRSRRSGRRRQRARAANRSRYRRSRIRPEGRGADPDSRRRRVPRPRHRLGSLQPAVAARLSNRRHDSPHRQQSNRLYDRSGRRPFDALRVRLGKGLRRADRARQRRRRRRVHRRRASWRSISGARSRATC